MARWKREAAENPRLVAIVERFHLTHLLNYEHVEWHHMANLDARLSELGTKLCLITAHPDELRRRLKARSASWGEFLNETRTASLPERKPITERTSRLLRRSATGSPRAREAFGLQQLEIDTTSLQPSSAVEHVLDALFVG
jgi:hypothetical protein